jgi:uncharacterized membrane protein (Fun14 family)
MGGVHINQFFRNLIDMTFDFGTIATSVGIGGGVGFLLGYAIKKVIKIVLVLAGLSIAALSYMQMQGIVAINWDKLDGATRGTFAGLGNVTEHFPSMLPGLGDHVLTAISASGIPITGGLAAGFAFGFSKG